MILGKTKRSKKTKSRPEDFLNNLLGENVTTNPLLLDVITKVNKDETLHKRYVKEMCKVYRKMPHDDFMRNLYKIMLEFLTEPHDNPYSSMTLLFISKFLAEFKNETEENPCRAVFNFILKIDGDPDLQYRSCEFVNTLLTSLGPDADLEDNICESIMNHMGVRLKNASPNVRTQAIIAMNRLQDPTDPEDLVIKYFLYHLQNDPSPKVRHSIITHIALTTKTIPIIIEKLWDVDESVRRETYRYMMSEFPIKGLRIEQRQHFLEQGLKDESQHIRKICGNLLMKFWVKAYANNYISFLCAIKLDDKAEELIHFEKIARLTLNEIFKREKLSYLVDLLGFWSTGAAERREQQNGVEGEDEEEVDDDEGDENEYKRCIPMKVLKLEHAVYWACLVDHVARDEPGGLDEVLPEITVYCKYLSEIYHMTLSNRMEDWEKQVFQFTLYNLLSNFLHFDLADEIGRANISDFVCNILRDIDLNERNIELLVKIMEKVMPDNDRRLGLFQEIVTQLIVPRDSFEFISERADLKKVLENHTDIQVPIGALKVKILDLEEELTNYLSGKDYENAEKVTEKLTKAKTEYTDLLIPLFKQLPEGEAKLVELCKAKLSSVTISKCLKLIFSAITTVKVHKLPAGFNPLFKDFVRRYMESSEMEIRILALQCATTFALLFEPISKDVMFQLKKQFCQNKNPDAWQIAVRSIFEMLARYGLKHFDITDKYNSRRSTKNRQLFSGNEFMSQDEDEGSDDIDQSTKKADLLQIMSTLLQSCQYNDIRVAILRGYCTLCLCGDYVNSDIMEKLLTKYFDPGTEEYTSQMLGKFFEMLLRRGKQRYLEGALLPTVTAIVDSSYDSTLLEVKPSNVIRFVLNATKPGETVRPPTIHDRLAETFLLAIEDKLHSNRKLVQVLAMDLAVFEISPNAAHRKHLEEILDDILDDCEHIDKKCVQTMQNFKKMLNGTAANCRGLTFSSALLTNSVENPEEGPSATVSDEVVGDEVVGDGMATIDREQNDDGDEEVAGQLEKPATPNERERSRGGGVETPIYDELVSKTPTPPPAKRREVNSESSKSDDDDGSGAEDVPAVTQRTEAERSFEENIKALNNSAQEQQEAAAEKPTNFQEMDLLEVPVVRPIRSLRKSMNVPGAKTPKNKTPSVAMAVTTGRRATRRATPVDDDPSTPARRSSPDKKAAVAAAMTTGGRRTRKAALVVDSSDKRTPGRKARTTKKAPVMSTGRRTRRNAANVSSGDDNVVEVTTPVEGSPTKRAHLSTEAETRTLRSEPRATTPIPRRNTAEKTARGQYVVMKTMAQVLAEISSQGENESTASDVSHVDIPETQEPAQVEVNDDVDEEEEIEKSQLSKNENVESSQPEMPSRSRGRTRLSFSKIEKTPAKKPTVKAVKPKRVPSSTPKQKSPEISQTSTEKSSSVKPKRVPPSTPKQKSSEISQTSTEKSSSGCSTRQSVTIPEVVVSADTPKSQELSSSISSADSKRSSRKGTKTPSSQLMSTTKRSTRRKADKPPATPKDNVSIATQESNDDSIRTPSIVSSQLELPHSEEKLLTPDDSVHPSPYSSSTVRQLRGQTSKLDLTHSEENLLTPDDSVHPSPHSLSSVRRLRGQTSKLAETPSSVVRKSPNPPSPRRIISPPRKSADPNFVYSPLRKRKLQHSSTENTPRSNTKKSKFESPYPKARVAVSRNNIPSTLANPPDTTAETQEPPYPKARVSVSRRSIPSKLANPPDTNAETQESPYPKARVSLSRHSKTPAAGNDKSKVDTPNSQTRTQRSQRSTPSVVESPKSATVASPPQPPPPPANSSRLTSRIPTRQPRQPGTKSTSVPVRNPRSTSSSSSAIPRARTTSNKVGQILENRQKK